MAFTSLKIDSKGAKVKALQYIIGAKADGIFGKKTESLLKDYQKANKLTADGVCGQKTVSKIISNTPVLTVGATGKNVSAAECLLATMRCDGVFTNEEEAVVRTYQVAEDLSPTGKIDNEMLKRLWGLTTNPKTDTVVSTTGKNVKPVDYKQYDSRWGSTVFTKNNTYNKKQTIKNSGCGITSAAMIVATWWDKKITPKDTAAECVSKGYRTPNSGTDPGYFKYLAKKYGASKYLATKSVETAKSCIAAGGYVIVNVGPSVWTKGGHYIVWWKLDGNNNVYINDPASAKAARAKNKLETLKKATKGYYCFWK